MSTTIGRPPKLPNRKFGLLTPIALFYQPGTPVRWLCVCDCGTVKDIDPGCLNKARKRPTISCGCYRLQDRPRTHGARIHGKGKTWPEYWTWKAVKSRCHRKEDKDYRNYGARGITMCDRWRNSFENFIEDVGRKPSPIHTIERIENNGNYEPGNCKWATPKEQASNRRPKAEWSLKMLIALLLLVAPSLLGQQLPAFPQAQGGGAASIGGRGGQVLEVTNLNDSGAGSLRAAINVCAPRIVIFRIGGQITNLSRLQVNCPFLTIAGETAPGGGITIGGANMSGEALFIDTHDVIVRYLTCNGYNPNTPTGPDTGTVCFESTGGATNVIFDHLSIRWCGNKCWITYANDAAGKNLVKNVTLGWTLMDEPNTTHPVGPGTDAIAFPSLMTNQDFHHNMFVNMGHRIPMVATPGIRMVSNLTYNWGYFAVGMGGSSMDLVDNLWVAGNLNSGNSNPHPVQVWNGPGGNCLANCGDMPGPASVYMSGNVGPQGTDYQLTAQEAGNDAEGTPETGSPIPVAWQRSTPLPAEPFPITADPTSTLDAVLLPTIGNSQGLDCSGNWTGHQDSQDARVVAQYKARGPGNTFSGQFQQPAIAAGTPCPEDPVNHLPLAYEAKAGIPAGTPASTVAKNGYTVIENYINGSISAVTPPPPPPPPPTTSPSGSTVTSTGGSITDATGKVWTLGAAVSVASDSDCTPKSCGNVILQNGNQVPGTAAILVLYFNGTIYQENGAASWWSWSWNGNGWNKAAGDPRGTTPPPPTITGVNVSCLPQTVVFPSPSACTATVNGTGPFSNNVTWSANAPNGSFTPSSGATTATVIATSVMDPTKSGSATIAITQPVMPPSQPIFTITVGIAGGPTFTLTCTPTNGVYTCK